MKERLAVLIDEDFLRHSGVRHYVFDLVAVLRRQYDVDYLSHDAVGNEPATFDIVDFDDAYVANYGFLDDLVVGPGLSDVTRAVPHAPRPSSERGLVRRRGGRTLTRDRYAAALVYAPWCLARLPRLPAEVPVLLVSYDVIANEFALTQQNGPFEWAAAHTRGLRRAEAEGYGVLAITEASGQSLRALFPSVGPVAALPAFLAPSHAETSLSADAPLDERCLVMIGPLDERKGLRYLPKLVSRLESVDRVVVVGESRVPAQDAADFFEGLGVEQVTWLRRCRERTRQEALRTASMLLFPSDHEGLGLPILEAQVVGVPVAVRDRPPMNELLVEGCLLSGDPDDDAARVSDALDAPGSRAELAREARARWASDEVYGVVLERFGTLLHE